MATAESFCDLFCKAFDCAPEEFDRRVFWMCLYSHAALLARLLGPWKRNYFRQDFEFSLVKHLAKSDEVALEIDRFRSAHQRMGFWRGFLKVRVSGRRLLKLSGKVLAAAN